MKPTKAEITQAVAVMRLMNFFPSNETALPVIMATLSSMVGTQEQLAWLTKTLVTEVDEWPGLPQLRALFATRFKPADAIEGPPCTIVGHTPADGERRYVELEAHQELETIKLLAGKRAPPDHSADALVTALAQARSMPESPSTRLRKRAALREDLREERAATLEARTK